MADNVVVNGIIDAILSPIITFFGWIIKGIFSNQVLVILLFIILVNLLAIILMKKDKEYAEKRSKKN